MKNLSEEQKLKWAKLTGSVYFLLFGAINFAATVYYTEVYMLDYTILLLSCLPMLINRRSLYLGFGIIAAFISVYMAFAGFIFNLDPAIKTSQFAYNMGYLLVLSMLVSSSLLVYVGVDRVNSRVLLEKPNNGTRADCRVL